MFPDTPTRAKLDLAGSWRYSLDGKEWNGVSVPSAYDFAGKVTFMRTFDVKAEMLDKYAFELVVYGINYQSEIAINGIFIGRHMGGYSSFVLSIPANTLLVGSENTIKILVDNELTPTTTLPLRQRVGGWRTYGGIFRDIYILATPRLFIEGAQVTHESPKEGKSLKFSVRCDVSGRNSTMKLDPGDLLGLQVEFYDKLSGELAGRSGISQFPLQTSKSIPVTAEVVLPTPKTWSPETPDLYVCKCEIVHVVHKDVLVVDEYDLDVGVRDLQWNDGRLFVNGSPVLLKGIVWAEDQANFGSAMPYEALEKDIALIKTLGANLIRFLYPPHPYIMNLCDRYGIFVIEEIPLVGVPPEILSRDYYQDLATSYIREMVWRDRQHASVLAWGVGDELETTSSPAICDEISAMRNIIRSLDSRPVYFTTQTLQSPCFEHVDVVGLSAGEGDVKDFKESVKQWKAQFPEKPLLISRYGREIEPGNHNGYSDPVSMESQARTAMQYYDAIRELKIAGGVLWAFNDWRTDRPALSTHSHDPYLRTMGLVSHDREKRTAFDVVKSLFNGEKAQALPVGNFSTNAPIVYVISGILTLISFFFMYNGNRRFRDCVNRSFGHTYNFFADIRDQRILSYSHSMFLGIIVAVTWATVLSSIFSHYRNNVLLDDLLSQFMGDDLKEWFIRLIWNPVKFIGVVAALMMFKLIVLSILIRLFSAIVRANVHLYHAISVTMWSILPYVFLIPVAMILYRLSMETEFYILPVAAIVLILTLWVLIRLLKGVSIIYEVYPMKVYAFGFLVIIVASAVLYSYLDFTQSGSVYVKYILRAVKSST